MDDYYANVERIVAAAMAEIDEVKKCECKLTESTVDNCVDCTGNCLVCDNKGEINEEN
jgi:hypothetical protein